MPVTRKPVAAWLTRHPPAPAQRRALAAYQIVHLPDRWQTAGEVWDKVLSICEERPALIIAIMPDDMLVQLVTLAAPSPVIQPKQAYADFNHWTGKWQRVEAVLKPSYSAWNPGEELWNVSN